jgi:hypothetical protein
VTPSMSTRCLKPNLLRLLGFLDTFADVLRGLFTVYHCRALPQTRFVRRNRERAALAWPPFFYNKSCFIWVCVRDIPEVAFRDLRDRKMTRAGLVMLFFMALVTQSEAQQPQARVDIVQMSANFLASRVAALACDAVDKATEPKFISNQQNVTIRAMQVLKERNKNLSDPDLTAKVTAAQNATETAVKAEIAQNGCSSERIKALLKLYKIHSEMSLGD